jgi:hypothetical protein
MCSNPLAGGGLRSGTSRFRAVRVSLAVCTSVLLFATCDFVNKLNEPFKYSMVNLSGVVWDSAFNQPVKGARVSIDGTAQPDSSDSKGAFTIDGVRTGEHTLTVYRAGYDGASRNLDVTLRSEPFTLGLPRTEMAPTITEFSINTNAIKCIEDTVVFHFIAWDSSGGIDTVRIDPGMGRGVLKMTWGKTQYYIDDSLKFAYDSAKTYYPKLTVIGAKGDTSKKNASVTIPSNHCPVFTLLRIAPEGFINGKWGYVEVYISDPDNDFDYLSIDWGDTAAIEISPDTGVHWHEYNYSSNTFVNITIRLFDKSGAMTDTTIRTLVRSHSAPVLDNAIVFTPSQNLWPTDDSVTIEVKVLEIDGSYVSEIDWIINQDDTASVEAARVPYTPTTGAIGPYGNAFRHSFPTAKLKGTNEVDITVVDRSLFTSDVRGTFYIAGKP